MWCSVVVVWCGVVWCGVVLRLWEKGEKKTEKKENNLKKTFT